MLNTCRHLQVVCNAEMKFINVYAMWKGSIQDAAIFKSSRINKLLDDAGDKYQCVLLGDTAYPCLRYLMTPITNGE